MYGTFTSKIRLECSAITPPPNIVSHAHILAAMFTVYLDGQGSRNARVSDAVYQISSHKKSGKQVSNRYYIVRYVHRSDLVPLHLLLAGIPRLQQPPINFLTVSLMNHQTRVEAIKVLYSQALLHLGHDLNIFDAFCEGSGSNFRMIGDVKDDALRLGAL